MTDMTSDFARHAGLTHKIIRAGEAVGFTPTDWNTLAENRALFADIHAVLLGHSKIEPVNTSIIINVNRSIRSLYPDWVIKVVNQELENTGPAEFDVSSLCHWIHDDQNGGSVEGTVIYEHLKSKNMLADCLGLRDGEEIQRRGRKFFRKYFKGVDCGLWKSVVEGRSKGLNEPCSYVPFLCEGDGPGNVAIHWRSLLLHWFPDEIALRFK